MHSIRLRTQLGVWEITYVKYAVSLNRRVRRELLVRQTYEDAVPGITRYDEVLWRIV